MKSGGGSLSGLLARIVGWGILCLPGAALAQQASESEEPSTSSEQTRIIRSRRAPRVAGEPEVSSTVIAGEELRQPGVGAAELLRRVPGAQVSRTGTTSDLSSLSVRGARAAQLPVYLGHLRLNDDVLGVFDLSQVPLWMLQRVELYRSAPPLHFPRSAVAGALVLEPALPAGERARAQLMAGSFSTAGLSLGAAGGHGDRKSTGATSAAYRLSSAQNDFSYVDDGGTQFGASDDRKTRRQNADQITHDAWLVSRHSFLTSQGRLSVMGFANWFVREQGVAGVALTPSERARSRSQRKLAGLSASGACAPGGTCNFQVSSGVVITELTTSDPLAELSLGAASVEVKTLRFSQHGELSWQLPRSFLARMSVSSEESQLLGNQSVSESAPPQVLNRAVQQFGSSELSLEGRSVQLFARIAARIECAHSRGVQPSGSAVRAGCAGSGRGGAVYSPDSHWDFRGFVATGVQFPTLGQRYGVSASTRGNPQLAVERSYTSELGTSYSSRWSRQVAVWFDAALFAKWTRDMLAYQRSSLGYVRPFNIEAARSWGGELSAELGVTRWLRLNLSGSALRLTSISDSTERSVPFRAPLTASASLTVEDSSAAGALTAWSLEGATYVRSAMVADPAGLVEIPLQANVDIALRVQLARELEARLRLSNLLGSQVADLLGLPLPGRAAYLSLTWQTD